MVNDVDEAKRKRENRQRLRMRALECIFESWVLGQNNYVAAVRLYRQRYAQDYCPSRHTFRK